MKARHWDGMDPDVRMPSDRMEDGFAVTSVHRKRDSGGGASESWEWCGNGRVTVYHPNSVSEVLDSIRGLCDHYHGCLKSAEKGRDMNRSSFEFGFTHKISLDDYTDVLESGAAGLNLWMMETERKRDRRRYSGIDMHTGDRVLLDMGDDYAFMSIPGRGCVNAVPRFLAVNGGNAIGTVRAYFEGSEIFDGKAIRFQRREVPIAFGCAGRVPQALRECDASMICGTRELSSIGISISLQSLEKCHYYLRRSAKYAGSL